MALSNSDGRARSRGALNGGGPIFKSSDDRLVVVSGCFATPSAMREDARTHYWESRCRGSKGGDGRTVRLARRIAGSAVLAGGAERESENHDAAIAEHEKVGARHGRLMKMKKLDLATLERAYAGTAA